MKRLRWIGLAMLVLLELCAMGCAPDVTKLYQAKKYHTTTPRRRKA